MREKANFKLNGRDVSIPLGRDKKLLEILRDDLGMTGTKCGCDNGVCGACTVVVDGKEEKSCLYSSERLEGVNIITIEGLSVDSVHPIQKALIEAGAVQCGYCTPGIVMGLYALFSAGTGATDADIMRVLDRHLCRCTGYEALIEGAKDARALFAATRKG
jgi:carbon-monoxide dehydrogenase small subunit